MVTKGVVLVRFAGEGVCCVILMVAVIVGSTRRDLVEAAYTLGADSGGIVRRVMLPGAAPQIAETLRLVLGWAWTYVIVAELIGSSSGIGHMITDTISTIWNTEPMKMTSSFCASPTPAQRMSSGMNADAGR